MQLLVQKMEILPVNDLDIALHDFVSKDDKMAFYSCLQNNLEETRVISFASILRDNTGIVHSSIAIAWISVTNSIDLGLYRTNWLLKQIL